MKKSRKSGESPKRHLRPLYIGLLALSFLAAAIGIYNILSPVKTESGGLGEGQVSAGENLTHSLDLRLAAKATYQSSPLSLIQDVGTTSAGKSQIISFGVPTDGLTEYGLLMLPNTPKPAKGYPVIILCHGYINPTEYLTAEGYLSDMAFYASHGFAVVKPDFRGQGLSSGQGTPEGAYYSMSYNTDVMSLISSLKQTSYIDKTKINLWGHSMGAYIALRASVISKDIKNTILLSGPVGSFEQTYLSYIPPSDENNPEALRVRNQAFAKYGTPAEGNSFWKNASPTSFLADSSANIQIHVGALDPIVPPQLSADLNDFLNASHKTHEYYLYQDGRHGLMLQRPAIWARSLSAFQKE
jgi:dipeptidyl aminopeptidase/acylaminoacyl peptidase